MHLSWSFKTLIQQHNLQAYKIQVSFNFRSHRFTREITKILLTLPNQASSLLSSLNQLDLNILKKQSLDLFQKIRPYKLSEVIIKMRGIISISLSSLLRTIFLTIARFWIHILTNLTLLYRIYQTIMEYKIKIVSTIISKLSRINLNSGKTTPKSERTPTIESSYLKCLRKILINLSHLTNEMEIKFLRTRYLQKINRV